MPLEQFRTQVLLLHSEQTVLDRLSRGFSDRYTVHCATSGSEALNTLGETSIDVIVSTQDLPGMSGLESLREARRRSPETIGILLAGQAGNVVEALVGEDEVFQVVRGSVTPEALCSLATLPALNAHHSHKTRQICPYWKCLTIHKELVGKEQTSQTAVET